MSKTKSSLSLQRGRLAIEIKHSSARAKTDWFWKVCVEINDGLNSPVGRLYYIFRFLAFDGLACRTSPSPFCYDERHFILHCLIVECYVFINRSARSYQESAGGNHWWIPRGGPLTLHYYLGRKLPIYRRRRPHSATMADMSLCIVWQLIVIVTYLSTGAPDSIKNLPVGIHWWIPRGVLWPFIIILDGDPHPLFIIDLTRFLFCLNVSRCKA